MSPFLLLTTLPVTFPPSKLSSYLPVTVSPSKLSSCHRLFFSFWSIHSSSLPYQFLLFGPQFTHHMLLMLSNVDMSNTKHITSFYPPNLLNIRLYKKRCQTGGNTLQPSGEMEQIYIPAGIYSQG
jgi:hypothetical protein